jgi:hypothetical protein
MHKNAGFDDIMIQPFAPSVCQDCNLMIQMPWSYPPISDDIF